MAEKLLLNYRERAGKLFVEVLLNKRAKFNYLFVYKAGSNYYLEDSYLSGIYKFSSEIDLNALILTFSKSSIYNIKPGFIKTNIDIDSLNIIVNYIETNYKDLLVKNKSLIDKVYNLVREIYRQNL